MMTITVSKFKNKIKFKKKILLSILSSKENKKYSLHYRKVVRTYCHCVSAGNPE